MRHDPVFTSWLVRCASREDAGKLQQWLRDGLAADCVCEDVVRSGTGDQATSAVERHRLGDYFADVRPLPGPPDDPTSFRVLFHRRPDAGRYWKDLMLRVLQVLRRAADNATTTLEYWGDEESKVLGAGR
jgi:hypothetical protein